MFDNYYPKRKDWRQQYFGAKAYFRDCRNHGSCAWCANGRAHKNNTRKYSADEQIKELNYMEDHHADSIKGD